MTQLNPNYIQALTYSARLDRQHLRNTMTEGVISGMKVVQRAAGPQMNVDISVGVGVIYGDDQVDQGAYQATCTAVENVTIAAAPGSNSRLDLVYWRINDPNAGGPAGNTSSFGVVTGTASASPVLPTLPTSAIPLASVLVAAGNVQVVDSMITSLRVPSFNKSAFPPSVPVPFFGPESLIPADHVLFNGQALNKDTYWRIYYYIGNAFGSTSTTFNTPDLRGRSVFGLDNMGGTDAGRLDTDIPNVLGGTGGAQKVALTQAETPVKSHTHPVDPPVTSVSIGDPAHDHPISAIQNATGFGTGGLTRGTGGTFSLAGANANITGITTGSVNIPQFDSGAGQDPAATGHNNMPPHMLCNWIARN